MKRSSLVAMATSSLLFCAGAVAFAQSGSKATGTKTDTAGSVTSADSPQGKNAGAAGTAKTTNPEGCDPAAKEGTTGYCAPEASGTTGTSGSTTGTSGTTSGSSTGAGATDSGASIGQGTTGAGTGTGAGSTTGTGTTGAGAGTAPGTTTP